MASETALVPSSSFRKEMKKRGGERGLRCYQCATCSSVCQLAPEGAPFPRRQMLMAQWGMEDRLAADPALWLCHQCNDCSVRCPRDVRPGDVMSVLRGLAVEKLSTPRFLGTLVGKAATTWPILILGPVVFWGIVLSIMNGGPTFSGWDTGTHYAGFAPHWLIYLIYMLSAAFAVAAAGASAMKFWKLLGQNGEREGSFFQHLIPAVKEIILHKRFEDCEAAKPRKKGHQLLFWGFVLAFITTTADAIAIHILGIHEVPFPLWHPVKIIGNAGAVLLVVGGFLLMSYRQNPEGNAGASTAFDTFFLGVVLLVIGTGVFTEAFGPSMLDLPAVLSGWFYILHLATVLTLFLTFPYSKFAHMLYRTLAMVHERMTTGVKE